MMRFLPMAEVLLWALLAVAIALDPSNLMVAALTVLFDAPQDAPAWLLQNLQLISPVVPILLLALAVIRLRFVRVSLVALMGFRKQTLGKDLAIGLLVGAASIVLTILCMRLVAPYAPLPPFDQFPAHLQVFFATVGALVPGVCEGVFFRGLQFRTGSHLPKPVVLLISAAAFAL